MKIVKSTFAQKKQRLRKIRLSLLYEAISTRKNILVVCGTVESITHFTGGIENMLKADNWDAANESGFDGEEHIAFGVPF